MDNPDNFILETKGCGLRFLVEYMENGLCNILDDDSQTILILNCDKLKNGINSSDLYKIEVIKEANKIWDEIYNHDFNDEWSYGDFISWGENMACLDKEGSLVLYLFPTFDGKIDEEFMNEAYEFTINCPTEHNLSITNCFKKIPILALNKCHRVAEIDRAEKIEDFNNLQYDPD